MRAAPIYASAAQRLPRNGGVVRAQTAATCLTFWLVIAMSSTTPDAQSPGSPASDALRFFDTVPPGEVSSILRALRPLPITSA
jgi:hypothetical protein